MPALPIDIPCAYGRVALAPLAMTAIARLATATDGAAEKSPANRFGWPAWPMSEKPTTAKPPRRALRPIGLLTCFTSNIRFHVGADNTKDKEESRCHGELVQNESGSMRTSNRVLKSQGGTAVAPRKS